MAWIKACEAAVAYNPNDIVKDGVLNPLYGMTGAGLAAGTGEIVVTRSSAVIDGGNLTGIDFTSMNTLTISGSNDSVRNIIVRVNGSDATKFESPQASGSFSGTLNVSGVTGVGYIELSIGYGYGTGHLYNIIAS